MGADARGALLLECSSSQSESVCRRMLLTLIKDAIELLEGGESVVGSDAHSVRVLIEPVEVVCEWDHRIQRAVFPSHAELMSLPDLPKGSTCARNVENGKARSKSAGSDSSD